MLGDLFEGCQQVDPMHQSVDVLSQPPQPVPTCKGVVAFADGEGRCISMLTAANIRRTTVARLFGAGPDESAKRGTIAPIVRAVYYECCHNDFAAALKYFHNARRLWPEAWRSMMALPRLWFIRIDLADRWPNFVITESPVGSPDRRVFGPFPTRKAANQYLASLRTAFALCRKPDLVDSPEKAATCPYLQMGTCPAPCVGNIPRQEYQRQIEHAVAAAAGRCGGFGEDLRRRMMEMAAKQQFEQAATLKKRLQALELLGGRDYRWTRDLSELAILHIDRWARVPPPDGGRRKVQSYVGYLFAGGRIHRFEPFIGEQTEALHAAATTALQTPDEFGWDHPGKDRLAIVASFIYRKNPPGIWIDVSGGLMPSPEEIAARIKQTYGHAGATGDADPPGTADQPPGETA